MKIVFFGTSLTGVDSYQTNSFVQIIEKEYPSYEICNYGIGGANSRKILKNVKEHFSQNKKCDYVFIEMGTNDISRRYQGRLDKAVGLEEFSKNYKESIRHLQQMSQNVVCISSPPVAKHFEFNMNKDIEEYNGVLKKICKEMNCEFIDVYSLFINNDSNLWSNGGLHLSNLGDKIIADEIKNLI